MSLINQMLKDLESRKSPDAATQSMLAGMGNSSDRGTSRNLIIGLLLVVLVLAAATGYMVWHKSPSAIADKSQQAAAPQPTSTSVAASPTAPVSQPAPTPAMAQAVKPVVAEPPPAPALVTKAQKKPAAAVTAKRTEVTHIADDEETGYNSGGMEKRVRPLRPAQIADQHYQKGYSLLQAGDRQGAEKEWLKALVVDPAQANSREALAALYYSEGRKVEATEQLSEGLNYHPGSSQMSLLYARVQMENGDTAAAVATLERALQEQDQSPDFYAFLAAIYQRQGDYPKSIAAYQRALSREPKQGVWWMGIGISLERAGKPTEALTAYNEARDSRVLSPKLLDYVEGRIRALQQ